MMKILAPPALPPALPNKDQTVSVSTKRRRPPTAYDANTSLGVRESLERYKLRPRAARETGSAEFGSFFHTVDSSEGDRCAYPARLDTYGCAHDCSYCYAKSLLDFRGLWSPRAPLAADMAKVRALIPNLRGTVRLGGMTDCFHSAERRVRNAYKTINLLNAAGVPYLIVTKSALVVAPEYLNLYDPQLAHVQVSVTATSDAGGREYEKASPISARIAAAEELAAHGVEADHVKVWQTVGKLRRRHGMVLRGEPREPGYRVEDWLWEARRVRS